VRVDGLTDVIAVAAGGKHSLALKSNGTVWAWGSDSSGQLGNDTDKQGREKNAVSSHWADQCD
jgi:alpha-tubulin suppressor-like RCC1 family protein